MKKKSNTKTLFKFISALFSLLMPVSVFAVMPDSVFVDHDNGKMILIDNDGGFPSATIVLGGITIPGTCVNPINSVEQEILFCEEVSDAVTEEGSYNMLIDGDRFSVYMPQPILTPAPPPPPPANNDCACVTGVSTNGSGQWLQPPIPSDNFTFCLWDAPLTKPYTQQVWISGSFTYSGNNYTISALWDPNNPTYDPSNPGNSTSVCALHNDTTETFEVDHPVASDEQFDACFDWMLRGGGPCL